MVVDTANITGSYYPILNESVAQIGHKHTYLEKNEIKKQAIQIEQISQSGMGTVNR